MLDDITGIVMTIREKIESNENMFRKNEMMTRYTLVDPLLRGIGWDLSDPGTVVPEEGSVKGAGKTDYTMLGSTQTRNRPGTNDAVFPDALPVLVVEVKSLGSRLDSSAVKIVHYMETRGTRHGVLTDGRKWRIYEDPSAKAGWQKPKETVTGGSLMAELNSAVRTSDYLRMDGTDGKNLKVEFDMVEDSVETIVTTAALFGSHAVNSPHGFPDQPGR